MERASSRRTAAATAPCVVCGEPSTAENTLCSRACLLEARRELDANVAALHQLNDDGERRAALTARNGVLTAALIGWSP